jgi:hypothetical protein
MRILRRFLPNHRLRSFKSVLNFLEPGWHFLFKQQIDDPQGRRGQTIDGGHRLWERW